MTRARIEKVRPDPETAARLLQQARMHLTSAQTVGVDAESAYGLCYQAVLKACVAVLTASGRRASSGAGSHVVLLREAGRQLDLERSLAERVDHIRRSRHGVFYEGEEISPAELQAAIADTTTFIERVQETT